MEKSSSSKGANTAFVMDQEAAVAVAAIGDRGGFPPQSRSLAVESLLKHFLSSSNVGICNPS